MTKTQALTRQNPALKASVLLLAALFYALMAALPAYAEEPEDPTYNECFNMAQKAVKSDMVATQVEAATLGDEGWTTPATMNPNASDNVTLDADPQDNRAILPGLDGSQDFERALREQGARIIIDPEDSTGAPRVELDNVRPVEPAPEPEGSESTEESEEAAEPEMTSAEQYEFQRTVCRIKFGITF